MAFSSPIIASLLFALAISATLELSTCRGILEGNVSCFDCTKDYDLSGIKVLVKCNHVKKLAMATTEDSTGSFKVELPSDAAAETDQSPNVMNCHAKLFGGPVQLYASKKNMVSKILKLKNSKGSAGSSYRISTPLAVSVSCPSEQMNGPNSCDFGSSKTVDLPFPPEWGLAPSSFYVPVVPIIGIP